MVKFTLCIVAVPSTNALIIIKKKEEFLTILTKGIIFLV